MNKNRDIPIEAFSHFTGEDVPFVISPFGGLDERAQAKDPHRHEFYELLFVSGGEGVHVLDFEPFEIRPPMCFFLSPGQVHFWELKRKLEGYAVLFPEDFLIFPDSGLNHSHALSFFHNVGRDPLLHFKQDDANTLLGLLQSMEKEFHIIGKHRPSVLRAYLHILIVQLERLYVSEQNNVTETASSSLARQFKRMVSDCFTTMRSVQDYADKIGISPNHLSDTIKSVTGFSPGQIIRKEIILEAKRLLAHSQLTAAEIAYRLNFEDPAYFGRFFKRESGHSPSVFRQQIRENHQIPQA